MNSRDSSWQRAQETARRNATKGRLLVKIFYARPVGRALRRYIASNGNVLAGGVAYYSLASIAAALVLAVTIASFVVISNETMRDGIVNFIGNAIPGIFKTEDGQTGLIDPTTLSPTPMSGVVGLIAFLVLIYTATRYMRGMRAATQTMLGKASAKVIPGTLSDVIALVALALTAVVAAGFQIVAGSLANHVAGWIGGADLTAATVRAVAALAGLAANVAFVAIVFLVLGSARAPRQNSCANYWAHGSRYRRVATREQLLRDRGLVQYRAGSIRGGDCGAAVRGLRLAGHAHCGGVDRRRGRWGRRQPSGGAAAVPSPAHRQRCHHASGDRLQGTAKHAARRKLNRTVLRATVPNATVRRSSARA